MGGHFRVFQNRGPEDLVNGIIAAGPFSSYKRTIEGTDIKVYVYEKWQKEYGEGNVAILDAASPEPRVVHPEPTLDPLVH